MKKRAAALCLSVCLMFSAMPFAAAAQETSVADSSQSVTAQQPGFTVTPKMNDAKNRLTIDVKADKEGTFVLRRARDKGTWTIVGDTRKIGAGERITWESLNVKDNDGTGLQYQVISLASIGKTSPAVTIASDKNGTFSTRTAVVDMVLQESEKDKDTAIEEGDKKQAPSSEGTDDAQTAQTDKKPEAGTTNQANKTPGDSATSPKATASPSTVRPGATSVTTTPDASKPAVKSSANRSQSVSYPAKRKAVPKTGVAYGVTAMAPWLLLGSGIAIRYRKPRNK